MSAISFDPTVKITCSGPLLVIDNPPPAVVGQFAVGRLEPAIGSDGTEVVLAKNALFGVQRTMCGEVQAVVWAGLMSVVLGVLKSHKVLFKFAAAVVNTNATVSTVNTVGESGVDNADTTVNADTAFNVVNANATSTAVNTTTAEVITDPAVVSFVTSAPRGLVRYGETVDVLLLIVQICLALITAKVVVIVRRREDAVHLTNLLKRHGIFPATTGGGTVIDVRQRVVITLLGQMGCVELNKADIVLVADALGSTWEDPLTAGPAPDPNEPGARRTQKATGLMERLADAGAARVFGFLPCNRNRSPFELVRCWQLYGMNELVVLHTSIVGRRVVVGRVTSHTGETVKNTANYVKNKIRMNPQRNRCLAKLAHALQAGDEQKLRHLSPSCALASYANVPRHVLLLAENLKQATALGSYLPDWPVVSGLGDDATIIKGDTVSDMRGVIATSLGVEMLAGDEFDVIVRADAGDGPPPLPAGWLKTTQFPPRELLLIDVEDTGHHLAALWARQRQRQYRCAGWAFLDEDADVSAWKRFRELIHERRDRS